MYISRDRIKFNLNETLGKEQLYKLLTDTWKISLIINKGLILKMSL